MSTAERLSSMMSHDLEIGTPNKPPRLMSMSQYSEWKHRFESFIAYSDPSLRIPITNGYDAPMVESFDGLKPKSLSDLTAEEMKAYEREKKAYAALTMGLTSEILHGFRQNKTSKALWDALQTRYEGNDELKKSKKDLLKKQFDVFEFLPNENLDILITRFSQLMAELDEHGVKFSTDEINEKLLDALPENWNVHTLLMKQTMDLSKMTLEQVIGKLQSFDMNMKRKQAGNKIQRQDPSMYSVKSGSTSSASGIALFSGSNSFTEETQSVVAGSGSQTCYVAGSSSASKGLNIKVAEEHVKLFNCFIAAYDDCINGKIAAPDMADEDYDQVHPDDLEEMDIQWNMAMLVRRAKRFLQRTGRAKIGGNAKSRLGFDKSKVQCYNCKNHGHFARECEQPKQPASGITTPSAPRISTGDSQISSSASALVAQQNDAYDWSIQAEQTERPFALMAITDNKPIEEIE